jgi:hypothetical protein
MVARAQVNAKQLARGLAGVGVRRRPKQGGCAKLAESGYAGCTPRTKRMG